MIQDIWGVKDKESRITRDESCKKSSLVLCYFVVHAAHADADGPASVEHAAGADGCSLQRADGGAHGEDRPTPL